MELFVGLLVMVVVGVPLVWLFAFIGFKIDNRFLDSDMQYMAETKAGRFGWAVAIGIISTAIIVSVVILLGSVATSIGGVIIG